MAINPPADVLRVGFIGSGFVARFHLQALISVRNVGVSGVFSPTPNNREALANMANDLGLGPCRVFDSIDALVSSNEVDAVYILGPNNARLENMRIIHRIVKEKRKTLLGVACEKPLGRTLAEAREMLRLAEDAGLNHGYLENQVFSTPVQRGKEIIWRRAVPNAGRPYLARASEEHSGPHMPWFWQADKQGGGVLLDMLCHSAEVARYLLTDPEKDRNSLRVKTINGTVANLKWTRPDQIEELKRLMGPEVDYAKRPAEDYARATLTLEDDLGNPVMIEASTSWAYVGPGLKIELELLGPEYSMEFNSLNTGLKIFLSRRVVGSAGEDLVEKQNAEQGLMPVLDDEAGIYGYTAENRHMVEAFRTGTLPAETFRDGVAVMEVLMALYRSAELGRTVDLQAEAETLENFTPAVARSR